MSTIKSTNLFALDNLIIIIVLNKSIQNMSTLKTGPITNLVGFQHYNNKGLFCDPHIIANNKERSFRKPAFTNHNSLQNLKLLRYQNIRTRTITSPSQLPNLTQSQNFFDYNCFYILCAINITSKTICNKPITAMT
jgi:hypothetical protein